MQALPGMYNNVEVVLPALQMQTLSTAPTLPKNEAKTGELGNGIQTFQNPLIKETT